MSLRCYYSVLLSQCFKVDSIDRAQTLSRRFSGSSTEGIQMAYERYGKPPLLIMHCLFGSKTNWITFSKALNVTLNRTVFTIDFRNHGESPHTDDFTFDALSKDIKRFLDSLSVKKVSLMGHSMGGKAAMYYALQFPDYVEKIITIDMSPFSTSSERKYLFKFFDAMRSVKVDNSLSEPDGRKLARKQLTEILKSRLVVDFLLLNFYKSEGIFKWRLNIDVLEKNFFDNITTFPEIKGKCEKPILFIVGSKSDYVTPEDESKISTTFPYSKFIYLNTGHWVHAEDAKGTLNAIADFLKF